MKIYKLSLGKKHFSDDDFKTLTNNNLVCVHPDTGKGEGPDFVNAHKGDVFYVCRSNDTIEFIGMFVDSRPLCSILPNKNHEDWADREYVLLFDAKNKTSFDKELNTKIMPRFQSTFTHIPKGEFELFEKEILRPVFDISINELETKQKDLLESFTKNINYYTKLQEHYALLINDPTQLFQEINQLSPIELKKIQFSYIQRGDFSNQPVVLLRYKLLEKLLEGFQLNYEILEEVKKDINQNFEKNVFQAWSNPFRILYSLVYDKDKDELVDFFCKLINSVQERLNLTNETKINLVHLDGAQNQGNNEIWFAIYNNTFKTQKVAKQLFFRIKNGFEYGLLDNQNNKLNDLKIATDFDFEDVIVTFSRHVKTILNDNSMNQAKIGEYIEILEYKKQMILQGPPGTGKTYNAKKIAEQLIGVNTMDQIKIVQFHPSYSYEDFVRGIIAKNIDGKIVYETENKVFGEFAKKAKDSDLPFVLIIDEINRANLPVVLGELIYALEYRDEKIDSLYTLEGGDNKIIIPKNLYIIGTMNTADRSVGHIDYAIKRRFAFVDVLPNEESIKNEKAKALFKIVSELFVKEEAGKKGNSEFLAPDFNFKDVQLGHSYFILKEGTVEEQKVELSIRLVYEILPILNEYIKDGLLLESDKLIQKLEAIEKFEC